MKAAISEKRWNELGFRLRPGAQSTKTIPVVQSGYGGRLYPADQVEFGASAAKLPNPFYTEWGTDQYGRLGCAWRSL